jgi:hypothetical protein
MEAAALIRAFGGWGLETAQIRPGTRRGEARQDETKTRASAPDALSDKTWRQKDRQGERQGRGKWGRFGWIRRGRCRGPVDGPDRVSCALQGRLWMEMGS